MSIEQEFDSNFRYVLVAARRARQLQNGAEPLVHEVAEGLPRGAGGDRGGEDCLCKDGRCEGAEAGGRIAGRAKVCVVGQ